MATTDLGKWMITNGGNYNPESTYEQLTMVMYDNSTYITLKTVTGVTPSNDGVNYILMAQGFDATALSAVTATDTSGLLGDSGETVSAQSLVDCLADAVATKLLKKTDIATVQSGSTTTVPASALLKTTDDKIGATSDLPGDAKNVVDAIVSLNSDLNNRNDVTDLLAEADVGINSKRIVNCGANTLNTPFKAGLTNAAQGTAYINMANENYGTVIYVANSGYEIFLRKKGSGVWDTNWAKLTTNADLDTSAMQLFDYSYKEFDFNNPNYLAGVYRLGSESRLSNAPNIDIAFSPILVIRENATDTLAMVGFPYSIEGTIVFRQANKARWSNAPWFKLEGVTI